MDNQDLDVPNLAAESFIKRVARLLLPVMTATMTLQPLAYAAPVPSLLAQQPKFVDQAVESNVVFLMDDSRSMEDIRLPVPPRLTPTAADVNGRVTVRGSATGFASGTWAVTSPISVERDNDWIYRSSTLNPLYYNPAIRYAPWNDNGRSGTSGRFGMSLFGPTNGEVTDSVTQFRYGLTPQDMRYAGPNYTYQSGFSAARLSTVTGANPPPVPPYMAASRPPAGGFAGENDGSRNADLFTSRMVQADGGPQQCAVPTTGPTLTGLPSVARDNTPQPATTRSTETRPSTAVPTSTRTTDPRASTPRPATTRDTPPRPFTTPTTAAASITARGSAALQVTTRTTQARPSAAPPATTDRTFQTRPSSAVTATTNRTTQPRTATTLQSPVTRTTTARVTEYRYETGVCGAGTFSAWSTTPPGARFCSDPTSEAARAAAIETRQSACPTGSSVDPGNANQCLSNCPAGSTASGTQCVYNCPAGSTLISGQCYGSCASGYSIDSSNTTQCISNCPTGTTASATQCVGTCAAGTDLIGGQCYGACGSGYAINGSAASSTQCVSNCPSGTTANATQCVGGTCPAGTTLIGGQCYSACPTGFSINSTNNTQCIQNCATGATTTATTCEACPTGFPTRSGSICYANCAGTVNPNNIAQCLNCGAGTLNAATAQCTNICPAGSNLIGGQCYGACPAGYQVNGSATTSTQCILTCPAGTSTTATQCLGTCPATHPSLRTTSSTTCYAACASGFTVVGTNNDTNFALCRSNCPTGQTALNATTCQGTCGTGTNLISGQCYGACNTGFGINGSAATSTQCISACPAGTTASGSQCLQACPTSHPTLSGGTCYAGCPATHPTVNPGNVAQCLGSCPPGSTLSGNECRQCPSNSTLLSNGQCCPTLSVTAGNCPVNKPSWAQCTAGLWVPDLDKPAPAHYYVFAPATPIASPTASDLSNAANFVRVNINRDARHDFPAVRDGCIGTCSWEDEAQNFANWYTYYRNRLSSAIAVTAESLSALTNEDGLDRLRLGYGSINYYAGGPNPYSATNAPIANTDVDGISSPGAIVRGVRPFTDARDSTGAVRSNSALDVDNDPRQEVFNWLFSLRAIGATPNREALDAVGRYFSKDNDTGPWIQPDNYNPRTPGSWRSSELPTEQLSCRRNYAMLITDGEWTNQPAPQQILIEDTLPATPLNALTTTVPSVGHVGGSPPYRYVPSENPQYSTGAGAITGTLTDVALYHWANDLRPDLLNSVIPPNPPIAGKIHNNAYWQHLTSYIVGYGLNASMDDEARTRRQAMITASQPTTPVASRPAIAWPPVEKNQLVVTDRDPICNYDAVTNPAGCGRTDDTFRAAMASRGNFLAATDLRDLAQGVKDAFEDINEVNGVGSALAGRSGTLRAGDRLFIGGFTTVRWTGRIQSFDAVEYFNAVGAPPTSADSRFPAASARNMLTSVDRNTGLVLPTGGSLAALSAEQQTALSNSEALLRWVRGDQSTEARNGGSLRNRGDGEIMGSVVNSQPIYSKAPDFGYQGNRRPAGATSAPVSGADSYADYVNLNRQHRPARVYVGANGGMLHAFDATGGPATNSNYMNEVFAYVPRAAFPRFPALASTGYNHRYLVDGPVVEGDVFLNGKWRTVLVGTTGAGPKGVFALDVTQRSLTPPYAATTVGASNVLFDITGNDTGDTDIRYMGHILQPGVIGSAKDGEWYYFVGNGYESQEDEARLLAIRIRDGEVFTIGTDGAGGPTPTSTVVNQRPNGLGGVTPVYDGNRNIVALYGGDRLGRLWKFDVQNWSLRTTSLPANHVPSTWRSTQLFDAVSPTGVPQPITAAPRIMRHPLGGRMIVFGTGKLFEELDITDVTNVQSVYGVWERNTDVPTYVPATDLLRLSLEDRVAGGTRFRVLTGIPSGGFPWTGASPKSGWVFDLLVGTSRGERVLQAPVENFGFANVTTYEPSEDGNPCLGGGRSFFYRLDITGSFTRSPFLNTGPVSELANASTGGVPPNLIIGSELLGPTINRLEQLVIPATSTTDTSATLSQTQTRDLADRQAATSTNPCSAAKLRGPGNRGNTLNAPTPNCPTTPLRVWRDMPRGPR